MQQDRWTYLEFEESVKAYLWMLDKEQRGEVYIKKKVNQSLREGVLCKRTSGAIEYRMENISSVLNELGLPWIEGYKPHGHVGSNAKKIILGILRDLNFLPDVDFKGQGDFANIVKEPKANYFPEKKTGLSSRYPRSPLVKGWVLHNAKGICESCNQKAPFITKQEFPYLEVHHVIPLSEGGEDSVNNAVALCPNCHKKYHFAINKDVLVEKLYSTVERLQRN